MEAVRRHNKLLISESPLVILPSLAILTSLNEAIFLQQLHYWLVKSGKERDGRIWIYNTVGQWQEQLPFWSVPTIRRIVDSLRERGLVIASDEYNKIKIDRTLWYTIDYDILDTLTNNESVISSDQIDHTIGSDWIDRGDQFDRTNNHRLPETSTETTKAASSPESDDKDGRATLELLRTYPTLVYLDNDAKRIAMQMEQDYSLDQIKAALQQTADRHDAKIGTGDRGIMAPLSYARGILVKEGQPTKSESETVKVSIPVNGSRGESYNQVVNMNKAKAIAAGYTIIGATP